MSTEHQPHHGQAIIIPYRGLERSGNVISLQPALPADGDAPDQDERLLAALSPLLDEVDGLRENDAQPAGADNFSRLIEENTRLRQLAVKLSNLLGDLPKQGA